MRLPPEVLSTVFEIYNTDVWTTYYLESSSWIRILHVCRMWREVAFSTPQLWTRIESASLDFVECSITHSGSLPLDVKGFGLEHSIALRILRELPRIRSLFLTFTPKILDFLHSKQIATSPTPFLDTLALNFTLVDMEFPPSLLPFSDAPLSKLTTLIIQNGSFSLVRSLVRPTLQTLTILHPMPMLYSVEEMVELLANLPFLRDVSLHDAISHPFADTDQVPQVARTVKLPRLSHMSLREYSDGRVAAYLFAHLDLTEDACVDFHSEDLSSLAQRFAALDSFIPNAVTPGGRLFCPGSIEVHARETRVTMRLWSRALQRWKYSTLDSEQSAASEEPTIAVHLNNRHDVSHLVPTIHKLFEHISLSRLASLSLTGPYAHELEMLHLVQMKSLNTLLLRGPVYPSPFVEALCGPVPLAKIGPVDCVLPNLKNLELSGVRWRLHPDDVESGPWWHLIGSLRRRVRYAPQLVVDLLTITFPGNLFSADIEAMWDMGAADHYSIDPQGYRTDGKLLPLLETPPREPGHCRLAGIEDVHVLQRKIPTSMLILVQQN